MIASVLVMLTLGGSVATTYVPPSFVPLLNPAKVNVSHDSSALAAYYNATLTQIGSGNFGNASFLLETFPFVNIAPAVNATAQLANSDLATVNASAANATAAFSQAETLVKSKQYINATVFTLEGCALARQASESLADFQGPQTSKFKSESIPVSQYSKGSAAASGRIDGLLAECDRLGGALGLSGSTSGTAPILLIGSPQTAIETGGTVELVGNLTLQGSGISGQEVLFYLDGSYFGSIATGPGGDLAGSLRIPFVYNSTVVVQAFVAANSSAGIGGASSNVLTFEILFNQTSIVVGDPPAVLPTFGFDVTGNLTTVSGVALPYAPVRVTFLGESQMLYTDAEGSFATRLTVPANATNGVYYVYASFAPQGVFGPSVNFTSVQVVHLPMTLKVSVPSLVLAGFSATLTGTAAANGSAVAGASVVLRSPWGTFSTTTNSAGGFDFTLPVSPLEFAFSRSVSVDASAAQPYIAPGAVAESIGLFNLLLVVLPVAAVGIVGYEADRLGVLEGLKRRRGRQEEAWPEEAGAEETSVEALGVAGGPELVQAYRKALAMASRRHSIRFRRSQTIREIVSSVKAKDAGEGSRIFGEVMLAVEDFIYSETFDQARLGEVKGLLSRLEEVWR
ncbi:MAG: hypothetical protein JRN21_05075 [Nitrososphaerota archaeon]|nr:hypothetical protein [Nitrososphaerota archaeon]